MKKINVLHISGTIGGGVGTVVRSLIQNSDFEKIQPMLLYCNSLSGEYREFIAKYGIRSIQLSSCAETVSQIRSIKPKRKSRGSVVLAKQGSVSKGSQLYFTFKQIYLFFRYDILKIAVIVRTIRKFSIDLIHTHRDLIHCKPEIVAALITGVPIISHIHGYLDQSYFERLFARWVNSFIYISKHVASIHEKRRNSSANGVVIHNGIDMIAFQKNDADYSLRSILELEESDILIGIVGRLERWKGQQYFIDAMRHVATAHPNARGIIIGGVGLAAENSLDGNAYYQSLMQSVRRHNFENNIFFTGHQKNIPDILANLDIVVHASCRPEPFGLVIIEAMAAGKPVVATNAGGVSDIIQDGKNGILIPMGDAMAMADAIRSLIEDTRKTEQIGKAAKIRVDQEFTIQKQVKAVQFLYESVLVKRGRKKK